MKSKKLLKAMSLVCALAIIISCVSYAASAIVIIKDVKNVILLIGDGMGENSIKWTEDELGYEAFTDTLPYRGYSQTDSLSGTTDSAAGATALSCGRKVYNSNLCSLAVLIDGNGATLCTYTNVSEVAKSLGKKVGIVTSDLNSGATPAGFSAHTYKRELAEEITEQQKSSGLDIIWAADNGLSKKEEFEKAGWTYAQTLSEIEETEKSGRSFAAISGCIYYDDGSESAAPLSALTSCAIEKLDNDNGFFLMVEGAHIDKNSHANNKEGMFNAFTEFDKSVKEAVEFAEKDGNTIVIVTADHETGGITYNEEKKCYEYTSDGHTNTDVPLLVYGSDELVKDGAAVKNTQVAKFIADKLGYEGRFPKAEINFGFIGELIAAIYKAATAKIAG